MNIMTIELTSLFLTHLFLTFILNHKAVVNIIKYFSKYFTQDKCLLIDFIK